MKRDKNNVLQEFEKMRRGEASHKKKAKGHPLSYDELFVASINKPRAQMTSIPIFY